MKLLFASDNHGDADILRKIADTFQSQVDAMYHCGDSTMQPDDPAMAPFTGIKGNNDWLLDYPQELLVKKGDERIFLTHGDRYNVYYGIGQLENEATRRHATIVAFGHTHQLLCGMRHGTLFINPGSTSLPRGEYAKLGGTFAIVTTAPHQLDVQYCDRQMKAVSNLHYSFSR